MSGFSDSIMKFPAFFISVFCILVTLSGASLAGEQRSGSLTVIDPWSRALPPTVKTGAAYLEVRNAGTGADRIVGASTPVAERVEIHSHEHVNGMMQMRKLDTVEVPPQGSLQFKSGGLHLMLLGLIEPLSEGLEFPLKLVFENAGSLEVTVKVERRYD